LLQSASPELRDTVRDVFAASDFVIDSLARDEQLLPQLLACPARLAAPLPLPPVLEENAFMAALRRWRRAELTRIAWRDLAGWATLGETLQDLSNAADGAIRAASALAWRQLAELHGAPAAGAADAGLVVIAMGKLGGRELNFSSDVDLVFLFGAHGETAGPRVLAHEEFYLRLGQRLIRYLDAPTGEGLAYRVDMRLRPFGASGPLVASAAAFEDYLERHGREWERYAWIKARAVTGAALYQDVFRDSVRPFVYRRYLDFGVFEALREMKALIEREVERRELKDNIKLGPGGIREIEFIVQSLQLIRGGTERRLQSGSLLETLPRLAGARLLPAQVTLELAAAYDFLRRLENRLQMYADQQSHTLPVEPLHQARVAAAMNCESWDQLATALEQHRRIVAAHFAALVQAADPGGPAQPAPLLALLEGEGGRVALQARLVQLGFVEAGATAQLLQDLHASSALRRLDEPGRRRLLALLGRLSEEVAPLPDALAVLRRLARVIEAIGARSTYFALLLENAAARRRLIELARHGDFLLAQIAAFPLLLDELLDQRLFERVPARAELAAELAARSAEVEEGDEEQLVEQLRRFQRAALFRIAVADLLGFLPLMVVSDRLTEVAELIIERVLTMSWDFVTTQLGTPRCGAGAARRAVRICAVGYGKLGGMELGYGSDLDLVFLHDSSGERQETEGVRSVDNQVFFVRFVQRVVHTLTWHSAAGRLYEVDMRLRPSGKGGMLITSIEAFEDYQRQEAWTWEQQALLHARAVAGDALLRERFTALRERVLQRDVKRDSLRQEVEKMRGRMRLELSEARSGEFDLKQDAGGIADVEFLAQYWALRWAGEYPPVAWYSDTIRQLESVASAALVPQATIDVLTHAYRRYRECSHHRAIAGLNSVVAGSAFTAERAAVTLIWEQAMRV
jgi:glutamate-ammonia-ligase adenylyltransferase